MIIFPLTDPLVAESLAAESLAAESLVAETLVAAHLCYQEQDLAAPQVAQIVRFFAHCCLHFAAAHCSRRAGTYLLLEGLLLTLA